MQTAGSGPAAARVVIPLPVGDMAGNRHLIQAAKVSLEFIKRTFGGATHTVTHPHAVEGHWFHPRTQRLITDAICLVLIDVPLAPTNPLLEAKIETLSERIKNEYLRLHSRPHPTKQDVIYITVESITVYS